VARINGTVYMTFQGGRLFVSSGGGPEGPFVPVGKNEMLTTDGGTIFPRLWGEDVTGDKDTVLLTHHQSIGKQAFAFAPIKRMQLCEDGVARATWWENNDSLRGSKVGVSVENLKTREVLRHPGLKDPTITSLMLTSGLWIEGMAVEGWERDLGVFGLMIGLATDVVPAFPGFFIGMTVNGTFAFGLQKDFYVNPQILSQHDRGVNITTLTDGFRKPLTVRVLLRTMWTQTTLVEYYVNDLHGMTLTLPHPASGVLDGISMNLTALHTLTLPSASFDES